MTPQNTIEKPIRWTTGMLCKCRHTLKFHGMNPNGKCEKCDCKKFEYNKDRVKRLPTTAENACGYERPLRKVLCQLHKGHKGSHCAVIFWEDLK